MNERECLDAIARGESAYGLLIEHAPGVERRFKRVCRTLSKLLNDARETFPDAQFYTASGGLNLMLGSPHDASGRQQSRLLALSGDGVEIGDGDF